MSKSLLLLSILFISVACNPLATTTSIESGYKPGLPASKDPAPIPNRYKGQHGFVVSQGAGRASSTNLTGDFEVSNGEAKVSGSTIHADIKFESTEVR